MGWRVRRQLVIFLIFALPFAAAGYFLVSKLVPEATCNDNRRNQGEIETDCGGPCLPCELKHPKEVQLFWARAVRAQENVYDAVALVQNTNEILASPRLTYEFAFFDEFGLIARREGSTFILPEERVHIIEPAINTKRVPTRVEFKAVSIKWEISIKEAPNLAVERREYRVAEDNGRRTGVAEASIFNRSLFDLRELEVLFTVTDSSGNVIGANRVLLENLLSGASKSVKSIWPEELKGEAAAVEVEPRVNVFDPTAILKPQ